MEQSNKFGIFSVNPKISTILSVNILIDHKFMQTAPLFHFEVYARSKEEKTWVLINSVKRLSFSITMKSKLNSFV